MQQFIFRKLRAKGSFSGMTTKFLATERLVKVIKKILKNTSPTSKALFSFFVQPFWSCRKTAWYESYDKF